MWLEQNIVRRGNFYDRFRGKRSLGTHEGKRQNRLKKLIEDTDV